MNIHLLLVLKLDFIAICFPLLRISQALGIDLCDVCTFGGVDSAFSSQPQGALTIAKTVVICFGWEDATSLHERMEC